MINMTELKIVDNPLLQWGWLLIDVIEGDIVVKTMVVLGKVVSTAFGLKSKKVIIIPSIIQYYGSW